MTLTSVIYNIIVDITSVNIFGIEQCKKNKNFGQYTNYIIQYNILQTPSNVGVLYRIIFSHTPDEAMSGGLAKACVPGKKYSVPEKIEFLNEYQTE